MVFFKETEHVGITREMFSNDGEFSLKYILPEDILKMVLPKKTERSLIFYVSKYVSEDNSDSLCHMDHLNDIRNLYQFRYVECKDDVLSYNVRHLDAVEIEGRTMDEVIAEVLQFIYLHDPDYQYVLDNYIAWLRNVLTKATDIEDGIFGRGGKFWGIGHHIGEVTSSYFDALYDYEYGQLICSGEIHCKIESSLQLSGKCKLSHCYGLPELMNDYCERVDLGLELKWKAAQFARENRSLKFLVVFREEILPIYYEIEAMRKDVSYDLKSAESKVNKNMLYYFMNDVKSTEIPGLRLAFEIIRDALEFRYYEMFLDLCRFYEKEEKIKEALNGIKDGHLKDLVSDMYNAIFGLWDYFEEFVPCWNHYIKDIIRNTKFMFAPDRIPECTEFVKWNWERDLLSQLGLGEYTINESVNFPYLF